MQDRVKSDQNNTKSKELLTSKLFRHKWNGSERARLGGGLTEVESDH